ncbi:MAG: hypothetical protein P8H62_10600, partial [Henriciella sp.]|nr:hypothetical protein [Henriciella sp.]
MRPALFALLAVTFLLPACTTAKTFVKDANAAVRAIPRPHLIGLDPTLSALKVWSNTAERSNCAMSMAATWSGTATNCLSAAK